jgi:hypothetical protein
LGQSGFRARVTAAYDFRCAITGSHNVHALEAAHMRPHSDDGPRVLSNGLLLRRDVHRLFDKGYLGIDPSDFTLKVSPQLRVDTGNGVEFEKASPERGDHSASREPEQPPITRVARVPYAREVPLGVEMSAQCRMIPPCRRN